MDDSGSERSDRVQSPSTPPKPFTVNAELEDAGLPYENNINEDEPLIVSDDPYVQDILQDSKDPRYAPRDRYCFAVVLMMILGAGTGYPWNFFVTATNYFQYSFRNITDPTQQTSYQKSFEDSLAVVSTTCGLVGLSLSAVLSRYINFRYRVYTGFAVIVAVFSVTTALAMRNTDAWQGGFFILTMGNVLVINLANSIACGGLFGLVGCLPSKMTTALMIGQSVAAVVVVLAQILAIVSGDGTPSAIRKEATGYFASAVAATVICLLAFALIIRLPVIRYYLETKKKDSGQIENLDRSLGSSESYAFVNPVKEAFPMKLVLKRTWKTGLSLILTFFVTIAVFPAVTTTVHSMNSGDHSLLTNDLFLPLACFLVYAVADMAGRGAHGALQYPTPQQGTLTLTASLVRFALIPLFMLCNNQPKRHLPVVFGDAVFVCFIAVLGVTNGYLGNLGMMYGAKLVPPAAAETTGTLMGVCLNIGLCLGSVFSFVLVYCL